MTERAADQDNQPPGVSHQDYVLAQMKLTNENLNQRIDQLRVLIDERDRLYDSRFRASEIAVQAALLAQKESVTNAFLASEKAIIKAEESQKDYNQRSNEFRGQLDDQAKLLMARSEAIGLFQSVDSKIETMRLFFDSRLESQRLAFERALEGVAKDINSLRESRSNVSGEKTGSSEFTARALSFGSMILVMIGITASILIAVFR